MELIRRLIYYGLCIIAIIGAFYTDQSPVVIADIFEPDKDSRGRARRYAESLLSEDDARELKQKRQAEIDSNTLTVIDNGWLEIYEQLKALKEGRAISDAYKIRLPSGQYPLSVFFFKPRETPISEVQSHLKRDNQQLYLRFYRSGGLSSSNSTSTAHKVEVYKYLRLDYRIYSGDDFDLGTGLSSYPRPPTWMLYPYRQYSIWIALFGLLAYILLPVKGISPNAIRYPRWRVMFGDLTASILTFTFFAMPFFIIGSAQQTISPYIFFSLVFWGISLLGLFSIKIALWYGSYQIDIRNEGLAIATYKGTRLYRFNEMDYYQPVVIKPPKWLIALSWLAALSGRVGEVGRALMLSSSETGSIGIRLRDGKDVFIIVTDQMGTTALKGFKEILERLDANMVTQKNETRQIRRIMIM